MSITMGGTSDVIVVGGGVAGLAAANALARRGLNVTLLEARARLGGRIFTARTKGWATPIEMGAEFIHEGNRSLWRFMQQHGLKAGRAPMAHWLFREGRLQKIGDVAAKIRRLTKRIVPSRMKGWSFADFLRAKCAGFSAEERVLAAGFVEGFEAAPTSRMSAAAMEGETLDPSGQYTLPAGYAGLIELLVARLARWRVGLHRRAIVRSIRWQRGGVVVRAGGRIFRARSVIITVPLGVLQARRSQRGAVTFEPPLREKEKLIARMQMGHVMRLTLRFDPKRWPVIVPAELQDERAGFGFIHSQVEGVPVWWSLTGHRVVTGWAGGPAALPLAGRSKAILREKALRSLSEIFGTPRRALRGALQGFAVHDWSRDPFSRGAYSFTAVGLENAARRLRQPVENTVFFAGEATAEAAEIGTVHGALSSGLRVAKEVHGVLQHTARTEPAARATREAPARRRQHRITRRG